MKAEATLINAEKGTIQHFCGTLYKYVPTSLKMNFLLKSRWKIIYLSRDTKKITLVFKAWAYKIYQSMRSAILHAVSYDSNTVCALSRDEVPSWKTFK